MTEGFTVTQRGTPVARADFLCSGRRCQTEHGATVYPDLPIATTRCPVCGSKRVKRVYTPPNISQGISKRTDAVLGPEYIRQQQKRDEARAAQRRTPMHIIPNFGASLQQPGGLNAAIQQGMAKFGWNQPVGGLNGQPGQARPVVGKIADVNLVPVKREATPLHGDRSIKGTGVPTAPANKRVGGRWIEDAKSTGGKA